MRKYGTIAALQVQKDRLIKQNIYSISELSQKLTMFIDKDGVSVASSGQGGLQLYDVHHRTQGDGKDGSILTIGFTGSYEDIQEQLDFYLPDKYFGGENIIIERSATPLLSEGNTVVINGENGFAELTIKGKLNPCVEYARWLLDQAEMAGTVTETKELLQYLSLPGMRGYEVESINIIPDNGTDKEIVITHESEVFGV
jgi:hypothetical protein